MRVIVGIPAFNEEKNIASLITQLKEITDEIIVCNDGSTDSTSKIAEESKNKVDNSNVFLNPIVTEITKLDKFWPAEDYHNNYYNNNMDQPYCRVIIKPKLDKLFE